MKKLAALLLGSLLTMQFAAAQSEPNGLSIRDIRIGQDKKIVLAQLGMNYGLWSFNLSGADGYMLLDKNNPKVVKGQINFAQDKVVAVSEEIAGPYSDQDAINITRNLYRLLSPYGRPTPEGISAATVQLRFQQISEPVTGEMVRMSFIVEPNIMINLSASVPDDVTKNSPAAFLSVFRNR